MGALEIRYKKFRIVFLFLALVCTFLTDLGILYSFNKTSSTEIASINQNSFQLKSNNEESLKKVSSIRYTDHNPIKIDGNSDFKAQAKAEGWSGDGSASNPIIIENLNITNDTTYLFVIRNSDLYCVIKNCYFSGFDILLESVQNVKFIGNNLQSTGISVRWVGGINRLQCLNISIKDNILTNGTDGIYFSAVKNSEISNNTISQMEESGIYVSGGEKNIISKNYVFNCGNFDHHDAGIFIQFAERVTVTDNRVENNSNIGMFVGLRESTIMYNIIKYNKHLFGMELDGPFNLVSQNWIQNNTGPGLFLQRISVENEITYNNFIDNNLQATPSFWGSTQAIDDEFYTEYSNKFDFNHWNDWTTPDNDFDGVVDEPYIILGDANNKDNHPLVSLADVVSKPILIYPNASKVLNGTILIQWNPSRDNLGHKITYAVYYSNNSGNSWNLIISDLKTTQFEWDTTKVPNFYNYRIMVEARCDAGKNETSISYSFEIKNNLPNVSEKTSGLNMFDIFLYIILLINITIIKRKISRKVRKSKWNIK